MSEPEQSREDLLTAMARFFATPERHYRQCPECQAEEVEEMVGVPSDGQNVEIHVLKRCEECGWVRAARFEADQSGRPPVIQREKDEEETEE